MSTTANLSFRKFIKDHNVQNGTRIQVDLPFGTRVRHLKLVVQAVQCYRGRNGHTEIVGVQEGTANIHRISWRDSEVKGIKVLPAFKIKG